MTHRTNKKEGRLVDQEEDMEPLNIDNKKQQEKTLCENFLTSYGEAERLTRLDVYYSILFFGSYLGSVLHIVIREWSNLYFCCLIAMIFHGVVQVLTSLKPALVQKYLSIKLLNNDPRNLTMVMYINMVFYMGEGWYRIPFFCLVLFNLYGSIINNHPFPFETTNIRFCYCTILVSVFLAFYLCDIKSVPVWIIIATLEGLGIFSRFVEANTDRRVLTVFELFFCQVEYSQLLTYFFLPLLRGIPLEYLAFKLIQSGIYLYLKWKYFGSYVMIHFQQQNRKILSQTSQNSYILRLPNKPQQILIGNMVTREQVEFTEEVCVFCHKQEPSFVSLMCTHVCMCLGCARKQMKKYVYPAVGNPYLKCPICSAFVLGYAKKEPAEGYRMFWRRKGVDTKKNFLGREIHYTFNQNLNPLNSDRE